ncbi:oligosaccharide flippase family protein [Pseudarthrobacter sp. BIM B-2242]|uniref:oligosaccharide flippase family protein n=1 Tax=Pseudarthrobacter sp. BIM B-2242 TaxID=2772401 RepID=UPI001CC51C7F|nr:oligosaccharide flippase family protein [Pseudarthrobacter sp. BIM B-2242]
MRRLWPILRGSLAYGAGPILGLLSGPILARALGPDGRGQFASIMEPITLAGAVASLGIPAAVAYFSAKGARAGSVYRRGIVLAIVPAVLTFIGMCIYAGEVSRQQNLPLGSLILCWAIIFPSAVIQIRRGFWQGQGRWRKLDAERFSFALLRFAVVVVLAFLGIAYAPSFALGSLAAFCVAALILWTPGSGVVFGRGRIRYAEVAKYSLGASLGTIAIVANNRLDQVLLPLVSPSRELGYYSIAVTVAEVPLIFGALAARNALHESGKGASTLQVAKAVGPFLVAAVGASAILATIAPGLVPLFFGASFVPSVASVQVLVIGTGFACISMTLISIIAGRGKPAMSSLIPLGGLLVTIAGFIYVGDAMNSTRAAYISLFSQVSALFIAILILFVFRNRPSRRGVTEIESTSLVGVINSARGK